MNGTNGANGAAKPYLLFDAGGTLVFPDPDRLAEAARDHEIAPDHDAIFKQCFKVIYGYDEAVRDGRRWVLYSQGDFLRRVYTGLGVSDQAVARAVERAQELDRRQSLWMRTYPWVAPALEALRAAGFRMSVISNSDGRVEAMLTGLGLAGYFERIFDSGVVGIEKPDPALFRHAMGELGIEPAEAIYIGDIYYVDVWGANRAGLGALHLDPFGFYRQWPGARVADVRWVGDWLAKGTLASRDGDLFSARDFKLAVP